MKTSDLRIGNQIKYHDKIITVAGVVKNTIYFYGHNELCSDSNIGTYNPFQPIPLTEEFKTKFGYDKNVLVDKSGFVIFKNGYAYQFVFEDYIFINSIQNLYREITGIELELNKQKEDEL